MRENKVSTGPSKPTGGQSMSMPFGGLGHDLECVKFKAVEMILSWSGIEHQQELSTDRTDYIPNLSGFALLTALCREIRGR